MEIFSNMEPAAQWFFFYMSVLGGVAGFIAVIYAFFQVVNFVDKTRTAHLVSMRLLKGIEFKTEKKDD